MSRKPKAEYPISGRPAVDPEKRIGWSIRALVTNQVIQALKASMRIHDLPTRDQNTKVSSDVVRLALFLLLQKDELLTPELYEDPTWNSLKEKGLV